MPTEPKLSSEEELLKLTRENNKILRSMRRSIIAGRVMAWIKFLIVVIPLVIAYFYLRPYYHDTMKFYRDLVGNSAGKMNIIDQYTNILNQIK
jgi:hypothetical protein